MSERIWYISKYANVPTADDAWGRAFYLLREMAKQGHHCLMISSASNHLVPTPDFHGPYLDHMVDGLRVVRLRALKYRSDQSSGILRILSWLDFEWRTWRYSKNFAPPPTVIIASSLSLLTILTGLLLRRRYKCRLAFEVRDIWPLTLTEEAGYSASNPLIRILAWIERLGYRKADYIIGTMPNLREHVAEVVGTEMEVGCIPMGIEDDWCLRQKDVSASYLAENIPPGKFIVGYTGTIGVTNALETLIECARDLRDRQDIHFLLVGNGYLKDRYRKACADLPNISFAPAVPKAMVQSVLSRCDVLYFAVHKSKVWKFGQSLNKIVDYMLAGKAIIGSYTGFRSMLNEAGSGTYVAAGDARELRDEILRYAAMPVVERERMGRAARAWILANRPYAKLAEDYVRLLKGRSNRETTRA